MPPNPDYSNREIDEMMKKVHEKLDLILSQTTATNGKVAELQEWKSFTKGALAMITVLIVPVLIYIVQHFLTK